MLKHISHSGGVTNVDEIQFATRFGYMFPELASSSDCKLPVGQDTTRALIDLGTAMAADRAAPPSPNDALHVSDVSSFFTYFGQFIDHDLTARTDRETETSEVFAPDGGALPIAPRDPAEVEATLRNGRRAQFDLDSLYGDGPSLLRHPDPNDPAKTVPAPGSGTTAQALYNDDYTLKLQVLQEAAAGAPAIFDLPRPRAAPAEPGKEPELRANPRMALIADMRNDENINVSQLHAALIAFHNAVLRGLWLEYVASDDEPHGDRRERKKKQHRTAEEALADIDDAGRAECFVRARQYVRWVYQFIVVNQYLKTVCLKPVVEDVLRNGPIFYGSVAGGLPLFMPLEFSVSAFRFGHSMIRPTYQLRGAADVPIEHILGVSAESRHGAPDILEPDPDPASPNAFRLMTGFTVDWSKFFGPGAVNLARKIDPLIAHGLGKLTFESIQQKVISHLAQRNLLRAFSLSVPTGQAVAAACGVEPLTPYQLTNGLGDGESPEPDDGMPGAPATKSPGEMLKAVLIKGSMATRTPLWCYILREAQVQTDGKSLGIVGSRVVAETIVGLLKKDPNSYLSQYGISRNIVKEGIDVPVPDGVTVPGLPADCPQSRAIVGTFEGLLYIAGLYPDGASAVKPGKVRDRFER